MDASGMKEYVYKVGLKTEVIFSRYTKWAKEYDRDLNDEVYKGPSIMANALKDMFSDEATRSQIKIIDIAAGTGQAGLRLQPYGFTNIDALEPSEGMLNQLKEKSIYKDTFLNLLDGNPLPIDAGTYDVAIIVGGLGEGHIPCKGLDELARIVKPGGYVLNVMRENYIYEVEEYKDKLEPHIAKLETDGVWKLVSRTLYPDYYYDFTGVLFTCQVV